MLKHLCRARFHLSHLLWLSLFLSCVSASAQNVGPAAAPQPLTEERIEQLNNLRNNIRADQSTIEITEQQVSAATGDAKFIFNARLDQSWINLLENIQIYADAVAADKRNDFIVEDYVPDVIELLKQQPAIAELIITRTRERLVLPADDLSASEQAAAYKQLYKLYNNNIETARIFISSLEAAEAFDVDTKAGKAMASATLKEFATNVSVFLELSINKMDGLRAGAAVLPDDAELKARLAVAESNVRDTAILLESILTQMRRLELDTGAYQGLLLTATGKITSDLFEWPVLQDLILEWGNSLMTSLAENGPALALQFLLFIVIIAAFWWASRLVERLVRKALSSKKVQISQLLERMIISTAGSLIIVVGFLIALSQIGISLGPLLAGLGIAGFVLGFALQDSLSNFASGMLILFYRPFDVGDLVEAGGVYGRIHQMSLVNTTFLTLDNQTIILPNSLIWGGVIKNVTAQRARRIDMIFGISYSDDIPKTERVLNEILEAHEKVLKDPEPLVRVNELGDSSVNFAVRPWVLSDDYLDVFWDITRAVKIRFDEEGICIPFPQRDVHLFTQAERDSATADQSTQASNTTEKQWDNTTDEPPTDEQG